MRAWMLGLALVLAVAGAASFDTLSPPVAAEPPGTLVEVRGGTLACPFALFGRGRAYLDLLNVGEQPTAARVSIIPDRGRPQVRSVPLAPDRPTGMSLHGTVEGGGLVLIEYSDGPVVASHSAWFRPGGGRRPGAVGGACARADAPEVVVPHTTTLGAEARLAVANPGGADADVTIALLADGDRLQPETLTRRIIPARSRRLFRLGDFAFDARDLTAVVTARAGRVVAQALVDTSTGVSLIGGRSTAPELMLLAGVSGAQTSFSLVAVGEDDAGIDARLLTRTGQGRAPRVPASLAPGGSVRMRVADRDGGRAAAYRFARTVGAQLSAAVGWRRGTGARSDVAASEAVPAAERWAGVIGVRAEGAVARAILANPGPGPATIGVRVVSRDGQPRDERVSLAQGRLTSVTLGRGSGAFGVIVESDLPIAVLLEGVASRVAMYALAIPAAAFLSAVPAAVSIRPRVGVPAPERAG